MVIKQYEVGNFNVFCYLLGDEEAQEGLLIDPADDADWLLSEAESYGLEIKTIVNTHGHVDHVMGNQEIVRRTMARIVIHEKDAVRLRQPPSYLLEMFHATLGSGGRVWRTTNGGSTWVQETTGVKRDLFDVCLVDSLHAWACGYDGGVDTFSIVVSSNGGQTWTRQRIPNGGTYDLHGISFSDTLHGLAVGGNSSIYRTDNGGAVWAEVYPGIKEKADVVLVDSLWGWLVGSPYLPDGSLIQQTTDGGRTWITQTPGTNQRLFGVSFVDRRNGWAVGDNGTILHTSDGGAWVEEETGGRREMVESRIMIRPNPFIHFASIHGHAGERFALFDITGRLMGFYNGDRIGGDLKAGVYFIKIEGNDDKLIRIVKVR